MANSTDKFEYVLDRIGKNNPLILRTVFEEELYNMDISDDRFKNWETIDYAFMLNVCVIGSINPNFNRTDLIELANESVQRVNNEGSKELDEINKKEVEEWERKGSTGKKPEKDKINLLKNVTTPMDLVENWLLPLEIIGISSAILKKSKITNFKKIINDIVIDRIIHVNKNVEDTSNKFYDDIGIDQNQKSNYSQEFIENINSKSYSNFEHIVPDKICERLTYYGNDRDGKCGKFSKNQAILLRFNSNNSQDKAKIDELESIINEISNKIDFSNKTVVEYGIESIRRELYRNTPIDSGNLVKNWKVSITEDDGIDVYNEVDYADKVDYGYFDGVFWHPGYYTVEFAILKGALDMIKYQNMITLKSESDINSVNINNDNCDTNVQSGNSFDESCDKDQLTFKYSETTYLIQNKLVKLSIQSNKAVVKPVIRLKKLSDEIIIEGICNNIGSDFMLDFDIDDISVVGDYTFSLYDDQTLLKDNLVLKIGKQGFKVKDNH